MRVRLAAAVARIGATVLVVAAIVVVLVTALGSGDHPEKTGVARAGEPRITGPVVTARASDPSPRKPTVKPSVANGFLKKLAGKWVLTGGRNAYFQFGPDGGGQWIVLGRTLWSGRVSPRSSTTFDLSWEGTQGASYWRVRLTGGGTKLYVEGTRQTYRKAS